MKQLRAAAALSAVLMLLFAVTGAVFADETGEYILIGSGGKDVSVTLPLVDRQSTTAMQFGLVVETADGAAPDFRFSTGFRVQETRYDAATHTLNVYLADDGLLFRDQAEVLAVGSIANAASILPQQDSLRITGGGEPYAPATPTPTDPPPTATPGPTAPPAPGPDAPSPDLSGLREVLEQALQYGEAPYTTQSFAALQQAIADARALLKRADATPEQIEQARLALQNAIGALVPVSADATLPTAAEQHKPQPTARPWQGSTGGTGGTGGQGTGGSGTASPSPQPAASSNPAGGAGAQSGAATPAPTPGQGGQNGAPPAETQARGGVSWPIVILICLLVVAAFAGIFVFLLLPKKRRSRH